MQSLQFDKRKSGVSLIGDLQRGSHFCHFYQTKNDLFDILVPYFRAGLENNELCVWVISAPLELEDVKAALKKAVPHFEKYIKNGQIEIVPYAKWHAASRTPEKAISAAFDRVISRGFDCLRLACNAIPEKKGSKSFACYGADAINRYNVIAAFAYPRDEFDAIGLMEIVKKHQFTLVRNAGRWEVLESSEAHIVKDALQKSEEKLQSIFSNMSEGFAYCRIVLDAKGKPCDCILLEANAAFQRLTGLRVRNIIGKKATQALPGFKKNLAGWIGKFGEVALTGKPVRFEDYSEALKRWYAVSAFTPHKGYFAVMFSDITERWEFQQQLAALNDEFAASNEELRAESEERQKTEEILRDSQRDALKLMEDANAARLRVEEVNIKLQSEVTERNRAEETLRESEQRLKRSQEIAHLGSWELDVASNHLTWSDEVYRIFGLKPQAFKATYETFLERVHPDDRKAVDAAYLSSLREGKDTYEIEHRIIRRSSGEIRVVHEKCQHFRDKSGKIVRSVGMVQDITERKKIEDALSISEARTRSNIELTGQIVWATNARGEVTEDLPAWRKFTGQSYAGIKGSGWSRALHPDDLKRIIEVWKKAVATKTKYETEYRLRRHDGIYRNFLARGIPVFNTGGDIEEWFGICVDITERRRDEEKIRHLASFPQLNPNPIVELDENGKIIFSNLTAIKVLKELKVPKQIKLFLPEDFAHILKMFKSGKSKEFMREVRIKERFFIETLVFIPELKVARIYARDITHRKNAEELLKKAHDELEEKVRFRTDELVQANRKLLEEISKRKETEKQITARNVMLKLLNKSVSRKQYADSLIKLLKGWSKCSCAGLRLLDYEGRIPYESYVGFSKDFWEAENWLCVKTDNCACTRVIKGEPEAVDKPFMTKAGSFYCYDTLKLLRDLPRQDENKFRGVCIKNGFCSVAVIPIRHKNKLLGAIHLADKEVNKIDVKAREFIEALSEFIGEGVNKFNLEEKIHKDHFLLDAFFRHSISPFVFLDRDFNFIRVNDAFAAACGRGISEFLDHNYFEYCPDTKKEANFRRTIVTKAPHQAIAEQFECLNQSGEVTTYWDWALVPILDEKGDVFLLVLSLKDVTEEKRHEEKLLMTQKELEQARRLSDIGTLAATVAHELRNPLAAINMAASNIRRKANNPDLERHLFNIEKKVTESDQIISNLLFYSRIKPPRCENINLSEIINECVDGTQGRFEKNISIDVEVEPIKDIPVFADPLQMKEVFSNILNNACDAVLDAKGRIEITGRDEDGMIKVAIRDNGCGIDKFHLEKVFDPFFTTKAKGTGLGLAVCNQIVTFHKGTISIESELEKGTTVTVCIPKPK